MNETPQSKLLPVSRRNFLTVGSAGLLGLTLPEILRQEARATQPQRRHGAQSVILVWLEGGPSHLDMWDPKPDAPDGIRGEFRAIRTRAEGVQICEHMPHLAEVMDRCTLVRSLHHSIPEHGQGNVFIQTGHPPAPIFQYPSMGSLAAYLLPTNRGVPPYFRFVQPGDVTAAGSRAGYLGGAYNPCEVEHIGSGLPTTQPAQVSFEQVARFRLDGVSLPRGFTTDQLRNRDRLRSAFDTWFETLDKSGLPATLDKFQQAALDILQSPRTQQAFDLSQETPAAREVYGRNLFGQTLLVTRRLIEAGTRFVHVSARLGAGSLNPWDTHLNNFEELKKDLLPWLDQGLAALIADLDTRGLLESTIVYCVGEFGRTPRINVAAGRDHWSRAMSALLAGGGLKPGYVHGSTTRTGEDPDQNPCSPADILATIFHRLGFEPHHEIPTPSGRRLPIFREGKVQQAMLA